MENFFIYETELPDGIGFSAYGPVHLSFLAGILAAIFLILHFYNRSFRKTQRRIYLATASAALIMRGVFGEDTEFVCGYEAGCLGFTLYRQLTDLNVKCIILAPTTMMAEQGRKRIKTDKRDAVLIARCLAYHTYHGLAGSLRSCFPCRMRICCRCRHCRPGSFRSRYGRSG